MNRKNPVYFAARNGYQGFTSYFNEVFMPKDFTKIFILKGGPGTGKSTLMKRVRDAAKEWCDSIDSILCSSDPDSLDGIILRGDKRRIAILDGTAPHSTDPTLPMVVEEILDLGCAVQSTRIFPYRKQLEQLLEQKKFSYRLAYHFLIVCGEIKRNYQAVSKEKGFKNEEYKLKELLDGLCFCPQGKKEVRLYDAFGKDGLKTIPHSFDDDTRHIKIENSAHLMSSLLSFIEEQRKRFILVPDALCGTPKCIFLPDVKLALVHEDTSSLSEDMAHIYDEALLLAQSHFADAAQYHFEMEKIYREALCFEQLDEIADNLIKKIKVLFSIS